MRRKLQASRRTSAPGPRATDAPAPYGGDLMAAMNAQDRDAVRVLMGRRDAPTHEPVDDGAPLGVEAFECAICKELLHKPVVNKCGHAACFWCTHKAMDPLSPSACPLCRAPFEHFSSVCEDLDNHIRRAFTEAAAARDRDVRNREEAFARSPDVPNLIGDLFTCRRCGAPKATYVTNCGHALCGGCAAGDCPCGARRIFAPDAPCQLACRVAGVSPAARVDAPAAEEPRPPAPKDEPAAQDGPAPPPAPPVAPPAPLYTHFGVGCDGCGVYPIRGRALRCADCPEAIGYDLCGACHDAPGSHPGRFAQAHRPEHRMEDRDEPETWLHALQRANPTLAVGEILRLARLSVDVAPPDPPA